MIRGESQPSIDSKVIQRDRQFLVEEVITQLDVTTITERIIRRKISKKIFCLRIVSTRVSLIAHHPHLLTELQAPQEVAENPRSAQLIRKRHLSSKRFRLRNLIISRIKFMLGDNQINSWILMYLILKVLSKSRTCLHRYCNQV